MSRSDGIGPSTPPSSQSQPPSPSPKKNGSTGPKPQLSKEESKTRTTSILRRRPSLKKFTSYLRPKLF